MSWTSLFKSKTGAPAAADRKLHWFGKLPSYSDYYSDPSDQAWVVEFNEWVLKGYENYHSRASADGSGPSRLPHSLCVIRLPKSGTTALASIRDHGGDARGRPFPMCFYVGVPTEDWPGPTSDRVWAAWPALEELSGLGREAETLGEEPGRLSEVFGNRQIDVAGLSRSGDDSWLERADAMRIADWFGSAIPGSDGRDLEDWLASVDRRGRDITRLESEASEFEATLCFPLASRGPLALQIAGWTRWLAARMDLRERAVSLIATHDVGDETGRFVVIARREIDAADFLLATSLRGTLTYVDDLAALPAERAAAETPARQAGPGATWANFVGSEPTGP